MLRIDTHQHLIGEPLLAALARRVAAPSVVRDGHGWSLRLAGEHDSRLAAADLDVRVREEQLERDGIDRALVSLSSALGIESLAAAEAAPLLDAYHAGAAELPWRFGAWGAVALADPDPGAVDTLLARGFVGLSLPAASLASPAAVERLGPLLAQLEQRDAPLFVHPGPAAATAPELPAWWPALTSYVAQMQAAWLAFVVAGRDAHPRLRVLFAMLAGGAPLQLERLTARSGARVAHDPLSFYDTSSYGPRAIAATIDAVGAGQLVHGSDRPVLDALVPPAETALGHALLCANPQRLFAPAAIAVAA